VANRVDVIVHPRIHLGLLSMHRESPRLNGGIGFAINGPAAQIETSEAGTLTVRDERSCPMEAAELSQLQGALEGFLISRGMERAASIRIFGDMLTHVGLGSATAIRLGAIEALAILNGCGASRVELVSASGRGGTSGVGINTYFDGGLICDVGKRNEGQPVLPSSRADPSRLPLALPALAMPEWPVLICIPRLIAPKTQEEEIDFFSRTAPLPESTSFEAAYVALFDIYASAAESDYAGFCRGVERMQQTAWKRAERSEYGCALAGIGDALLRAGADCVGMSSLGPLLFCLAAPAQMNAIAQAARLMGCDAHQTTRSCPVAWCSCGWSSAIAG